MTTISQALQFAVQLLETQSNHPEALLGLGIIAQQSGQDKIAEKLLNSVLQVEPESVKAWFSLGNLYQAQGNLTEAVKCFQKALALRPDLVVCYHNLGYILHQQGQLDEAISSYKKALELRPDFIEAEVNLANTLYAKGELSQEKKAHYALLNNDLGLSHQQKGNPKAAMAYYRQAILLKPDLVDAIYSLQELLSLEFKDAVSLNPEKTIRGNVLLSYINEPFLLQADDPIFNVPFHQCHWESLQIAKIWLELGYAVDVISYQNHSFIPQKNYDFLIDIRWNIQRLASIINQDCIKIFHIDIAHNLFNSCAELNRLLALQKRRGVTLHPRRFEMPNLAIEYANCAVMIGNDWTKSTFNYINKPIYHIPNSSMQLFPFPEEKDFENCRKNFLWLGSFGLVHKGLDLVLEAFAEMPDYYLKICGPIKREPDFEEAFYQELYQTPNIQTIGWIDISSPDFQNILNSCIGAVYASCSEGQSGSVITYLHGGLIPIISRECGMNIEDFGVGLNNCSIEEIKASVQWVANQPAQTLKQMSRKGWEYARANHTREKFTEEYRSAVEQIISTYQK